MFLKHYILLLMPFIINSVAGRLFRFDYEFNPYIEGWLKLHLIPATWRDAWLRCDLEGSILASPVNLIMKQALDTYSKEKKIDQCGYYTGVHALFSKGDFFSIDGVSLARMPVQWAFGEPNNADNNEDCIISVNGTIADVNCSEVFPYICYRKKTKDMILTPCGTVDKEYNLDPLTGNCYKFHRIATNWNRAFMTCAAEGGYLAIINSPKEANIIGKLYDTNRANISAGSNREVIHLGFHDWNEAGVWRTIHGQHIAAAGYAEWQPGQPDSNTPQNCGAMFASKKFDNYWCDKNAAFVCEKTPDSLLEP